MSMNKDNSPKVHRTALIDGDILLYRAAATAQTNQLDEQELLERVEFDVKDWARRAFCSDTIVCLSGPRELNFRREVYPLYKANRPDERPEFHGMATEIIEGNFTIFKRDMLEADDCMGLLATLKDGSGEPVVMNPVIVSGDKDMRTIPGWHFNPDIEKSRGEDFPVFVTPQDASRMFHLQWLTGDSGDGYPGIFRLGDKGAAKMLDNTDPLDWEGMVLDTYRQHKKEYTYEYCLQMARCARILMDKWWDTKAKKPVLWAPEPIFLTDKSVEWTEKVAVTVPAGA